MAFLGQRFICELKRNQRSSTLFEKIKTNQWKKVEQLLPSSVTFGSIQLHNEDSRILYLPAARTPNVENSSLQ